MKQDLEHLKLLAIFHYVVAGMTALFACIPFIHFFMGLALATGALGESDPEAQTIGIFFIAIAGLFILAGWTLAILMATTRPGMMARYSSTWGVGVWGCGGVGVGMAVGRGVGVARARWWAISARRRRASATATARGSGLGSLSSATRFVQWATSSA